MNSVLLLVDVQRNMLRPPEPVPDADRVGAAIAGLLDRARAAGVPVVHVRNTGGAGDPDEPGTDGWQLMHPPVPGESIVDKPECDAFVDTSLAELLPDAAELVVAGMQSEYCIRETTLGAVRRGYRVVLARGAHSTYDGERPAAETARRIEDELAAAGAIVLDHAEITFPR